MTMRITAKQIERAYQQGRYDLDTALHAGGTLPPPPQHIWQKIFYKKFVTIEDTQKLNYHWFLGYAKEYNEYIRIRNGVAFLLVEKHIKFLGETIQNQTLMADTGWPTVY